MDGYEIGVAGLGVMGSNLALNIAEHGYPVAVFDRNQYKIDYLRVEGSLWKVLGVVSLQALAAALRTPRAVIMLVAAGSPVDALIQALLPYLQPGDLLVDAGNSYFKDSDLRQKALADQGILYLGTGISGGEHGARYGPSLMPGGSPIAYERVRPIFEAVAARVAGEPCVAYMGDGSAGHYVKMVHNGIEYGLMQLIAETYDVMKRGLGLTDEALAAVYEAWNASELNAYLIEICAPILRQRDEQTGGRLIDAILDHAGQKGTGKWASQAAMDLYVPTPTIDIAVAMRNLSGLRDERVAASQRMGAPAARLACDDSKACLEQLRAGLYAGLAVTFAQGFALLQAASQAYEYGLNLAEVARVWRGGCIIRARLLQDIYAAYCTRPGLLNLLLDPHLGEQVAARLGALRAVVQMAVQAGLPVPAFSACMAYLDAYRSAWLPANLIQAQRDYFGAHTYKRLDMPGVFHTDWEKGHRP